MMLNTRTNVRVHLCDRLKDGARKGRCLHKETNGGIYQDPYRCVCMNAARLVNGKPQARKAHIQDR